MEPLLSITFAVSTRHSPIWLSVEDGTRRVDVDDLLVDERPVAFLGILLGSVAEEATENRLLYTPRVPSARHDVQLVTGRNGDSYISCHMCQRR